MAAAVATARVVVVVVGIQQMAACCLAGTEWWSGEAEAVSDVPPSGHCQEPTDPPLQPLMAPTLLSSTPAATEAEVKNRGSLVTSHVKASCVLRGDTRWKQTICARLYDPDVCVFPLVISPFWSDTVTDLRCLQLSFALKLT